jgi:hypothetical protein
MIEAKATEAFGGIWQPGVPHILMPLKPATCHIPTAVTWPLKQTVCSFPLGGAQARGCSYGENHGDNLHGCWDITPITIVIYPLINLQHLSGTALPSNASIFGVFLARLRVETTANHPTHPARLSFSDLEACHSLPPSP